MKILRFSEGHNTTGTHIKVLRKHWGLTEDLVIARMQVESIHIV